MKIKNTIFIVLWGLITATLWTACKKAPIETSEIQGYSLIRVSGNNQTDTVNLQLSAPLKVQVLDSLGVGIQGVKVNFSVDRGGGSLSATTVTTNVNGFSEVFWTIGPEIGNQIVSITANVTIPIHSLDNFYAYALPTIEGNYYQCPPTFGSITDSRDGEIYQTVAICNQTWMAENLRYDLPGITTLDTINPANPTSKYGRLYNWETLMNGDSSSASNPSGKQGICPNGWHIPSDSEWNELEVALGMPAEDTAYSASNYEARSGLHGIFLTSTTGWINSYAGTNSSGFNALPAGFTDWTGEFFRLNSYTRFWSSTKTFPQVWVVDAWSREFSSSSASRLISSINDGYSCRCLKD